MKTYLCGLDRLSEQQTYTKSPADPTPAGLSHKHTQRLTQSAAPRSQTARRRPPIPLLPRHPSIPCRRELFAQLVQNHALQHALQGPGPKLRVEAQLTKVVAHPGGGFEDDTGFGQALLSLLELAVYDVTGSIIYWPDVVILVPYQPPYCHDFHYLNPTH